MTKESILADIYQSQEVETVIRSIKPDHLQDDIKQHCFMELFEKSEDFIMELYNRGKLKNYILKILYNTSRFHRTKFKLQLGKEEPTEFFEDKPDQEYTEIDIEPTLKKIYWYKSELVKLYSKLGTYQKVSDLTGIPLKSVYSAIVEARKEIIKKYYETRDN